MNEAPREILAATSICAALLVGAPAWAAQTAATADDLCLPTEDPCVISDVYEVTGPLDFGLRTVRLTGNGRLIGQPDIVIDCGELIVDTGDTKKPVLDPDGHNRGDLTISAYRACSGDGTTRCLDDSECTALSMGTCSVGNGAVLLDGSVSGTGPDPGTGTVLAAGDISIGRTFDFSGGGIAIDGGNIEIESFGGAVTTTGQLRVKSSKGGAYGYYGGLGGRVTVRAATDVTIHAGITAWGRAGGGGVEIAAGRDLVLTSDVIGNGGGTIAAEGGTLDFTAGRNLIVVEDPNGKSLQNIETNGGSMFYFAGYGNYGAWYSGYGGYQYFTAGTDISLGGGARVRSQGGKAAPGGSIFFYADGRIDIDGQVRAQGLPPLAGGETGADGGSITLYGETGIRCGPTSQLVTASPAGVGVVRLHSGGPVELQGFIDVRATDSSDLMVEAGGQFSVVGTDTTVSGTIRGGGAAGSYDWTLDVCRMRLAANSRMQNVTKSTADPGDIKITVHESMIAEAKSHLVADASGGGRNVITYRDPSKPPVLAGEVSPAPLLNVDPSLVGCPVCGNGEIDQGESCDDGNTTSGDGCRDDCQDEGCVAQSPGFPTTPLCDDGDACTIDRCDPVAHTCLNIASCEEGVACTVDACVAGACEHTPDDVLCDDRNDCTDDICNATTGCVHASLSGGGCEDGDFCTVTGTCDRGTCSASDVSRTEKNRIRVKIEDGSANDAFKVRATVALTEVSADPTVTGLRVLVFDQSDQQIYQADLAAADWEDRRGDGLKFRFRDSQGPGGPARGIDKASVKRNLNKNTAKVAVRMKDGDIPNAANQSALSVSFLFGLDPAVDDCITARRVPCKPSETRVGCKD